MTVEHDRDGIENVNPAAEPSLRDTAPDDSRDAGAAKDDRRNAGAAADDDGDAGAAKDDRRNAGAGAAEDDGGDAGAGAAEDDGGDAEREPASDADDALHQCHALRMEVAELQQQLLRVHADFDNFRRRTRAEKEELSSYANAKLIGDLLPVMDNFALAMQSAAQTGETGGLAKGVDMVYRQLQTILEQAGVRQMEPEGQPFDPNLHEAVLSGSSDQHEPGTVTAVLRPGYYLKDRVLRPAMVQVSE
ncbi:MAG: nucleotide exchange factor GrpE [Bacilli bacterium]